MTEPAPSPPGRARRWWRLPVALGLLGAVLLWADPARVVGAMAQMDPLWVLAGLVTSTLANVASAWRWRALAAWLRHAVPMAWAVPVYFRGVAANVVLPGAVVGGDLLRTWSLHRRGMPLWEAGASVVLDRLSGLWVLLAVGAAALGWGLWMEAGVVVEGWRGAVDLIGLGSPGAAALALLAALLMGLAPYALLRWLPMAWAGRWPALRWWPLLAQHAPVRHCTQQILGSLLVQVGSIGTLYCGVHATGADLPWWMLAVAAVPIFLMATLPVSFGGWGTREAAAVAVLVPMGLEAPTAVAVSVLYGLYPMAQSLLALWPVPAEGAPPVRRS